jgi:hypothetical protein
MKELSKYVQTKNSWDKMFNKSFRPLNLIFVEDRQLLARMLSSDLSPENLSCDGELPMAEVIARARFLKKVASQLKAMDPSIQIDD